MDGLRVLVSTSPFGACGRQPLDELEATGWEIVHNPYGRRLRAGEVEEQLAGIDAAIAGTEPYPLEMLRRCRPRLKHIARVGIGLDNLDVAGCNELGISVSYTPNAPSRAVAELTVAQMFNLSRHILTSDRSVRDGSWNRQIGNLLGDLTVGIVGLGRIGRLVARMLQPFSTRLLACDIAPDTGLVAELGVELLGKEDLLSASDIVSLHIPASKRNHDYIDAAALNLMRPTACLINTSRGAVINETALVAALEADRLAGVALDVFRQEPYRGPLTRFDNVLFTSHIGASTVTSRRAMELGATRDCIRALRGDNLHNPAPPDQ